MRTLQERTSAGLEIIKSRHWKAVKAEVQDMIDDQVSDFKPGSPGNNERLAFVAALQQLIFNLEVTYPEQAKALQEAANFRLDDNR